MKIVGLSGSFRADSLNTKLLHYIGSRFDDSVEYEVFANLDSLPYYDDALEGAVPSYAARLRQEVGEADAVIVASPEYNHSYTPVIKNAIDWLSRPFGAGVLAGRVVALVGASPGLFGTVRAQSHLRQVLHAVDARLVTRPEVFVNDASTKFDVNGQLTDDVGAQLVGALVSRLYAEAGESRGEELSA